MLQRQYKYFSQTIKAQAKKVTKYANPIIFDYKEITNKNLDLRNKIEDTFGINSHGVAVIKNISNFSLNKMKHFENIMKLYNSPMEVKNSLRKHIEENVGWVDESETAKVAGEITKVENNANKYTNNYFGARYPDDIVRYDKDPKFVEDLRNVWPKELPELKEGFNYLMKNSNEILMGMMYHVDKYLSNIIPDLKMKNYEMMCKNSLLFGLSIIYTPKQIDDVSWLNWHTDVGILSGLFHPKYYNKNKQHIDHKKSGLCIRDKLGQEFELVFDEDDLVIIPGDLLFILSAGHIIPTEHIVDLTIEEARNLYRINQVVNFEPNFDQVIEIPNGEKYNNIIQKDPRKFNYSCLKSFTPGLDYRTYLKKGLKSEFIN